MRKLIPIAVAAAALVLGVSTPAYATGTAYTNPSTYGSATWFSGGSTETIRACANTSSVVRATVKWSQNGDTFTSSVLAGGAGDCNSKAINLPEGKGVQYRACVWTSQGTVIFCGSWRSDNA